mgnify:CR=1 FL=1
MHQLTLINGVVIMVQVIDNRPYCDSCQVVPVNFEWEYCDGCVEAIAEYLCRVEATQEDISYANV